MGWFLSKENRQKRQQAGLDEDLCWAVSVGNSDKIKALLNAGANVNSVNSDGDSVLITACYREHLCALDVILNEYPDVTYKSPKTGRTALHALAKSNDPYFRAYARNLVARGMDVNAEDNDGCTPLHLAVRHNSTVMTEMLIAAGADSAKKDKAGHSPYSLAQNFSPRKAEAYLQLLRVDVAPVPEMLRGDVAPTPKTQPADDATAGWKLTAGDVVACISPNMVGYRLTEIFNFGRGTYTQIAHNLDTHQETQVLRLFTEFNDKSLLETAYDRLVENGGKIAAPHFRRNRLNKKAM